MTSKGPNYPPIAQVLLCSRQPSGGSPRAVPGVPRGRPPDRPQTPARVRTAARLAFGRAQAVRCSGVPAAALHGARLARRPERHAAAVCPRGHGAPPLGRRLPLAAAADTQGHQCRGRQPSAAGAGFPSFGPLPLPSLLAPLMMGCHRECTLPGGTAPGPGAPIAV